jgi:hypothetical protein
LSLPRSEATASPLLPPTHTKYVFPNSIRCPWIRETEKGNSRAKYVFPNSIPFFGCCCEKTPIQFFTDGLEKKRERKETGLVYSSIFFELYGELAAVREVQKERPNEITATMGTGGKGWGARGQKQKPAVQSNRNGPALLRFAAPAFFLLPRGCRSCRRKGGSRAAAPPISSFSSPPPPPLLLYDALTVGLLYTSSQALMAAVAPRTHTCTPVPRCQ